MFGSWNIKPSEFQKCPYCLHTYSIRIAIDGKCPRCHIQLHNSTKGGEKVAGKVISVDGISSSMPFYTKVEKLANNNKRDIQGVEMGHGYAVLEFKWPMDINKMENHIRTYIASIYKGWVISRKELMLAIVDENYDLDHPDSRLEKPVLPKAKPSDNQTVDTTHCVTCNRHYTPMELVKGECPSCGTILDPSAVAPNEKEKDDGKNDADS